MKDKLELEIKELIEELLVSHDEDGIKDTAENYFKYIDSIRFIELIISVENKYEIEFRNEDLVLDNEKGLNDFITIIKSYINVN